MDALVFAFAGLSLAKSRKNVNDDFVDVGDRDLKRSRVAARPRPHNSVVHLLRSRGGTRRTKVAAAPISVDDPLPDAPTPSFLPPAKSRRTTIPTCAPRNARHTRADPPSVPIPVPPSIPITVAVPAATRGPVTVTITELVVTVRPVLNPAQQEELEAWNAQCVEAKSEESAHAPRRGPVTIVEGERRALNAWNFKCNQARGDESPHAPRRGPVRVTITEAVVNPRPVLTAGEQRELHDWNSRCLTARSDLGVHAPSSHVPVVDSTARRYSGSSALKDITNSGGRSKSADIGVSRGKGTHHIPRERTTFVAEGRAVE